MANVDRGIYENHGNEELIRLCLQGVDSAFEELVKRYQELVYKKAHYELSKMGFEEDLSHAAQDIRQKVFIKCYKRIDTINKPSSFVSWILRVTMNETIDYHRDYLRRRRLIIRSQALPEDVSDQPSVEDLTVERLELARVMEFLDADEQKVIDGWLKGKSQRQIASEIGKSQTKVSFTKKRAVEKLRGFLNV